MKTEDPRTFESPWLARSLDRHLLWGLLFMVVLVFGFAIYKFREPDLRARAAAQQQRTYTHLGKTLFANNCATCHGDNGTGGDGPTLNSRQFLTSTTDGQKEAIISAGISGTEMPAWSMDFGGTMTSEQIQQLIAYMRSWEPTAPDAPNWRKGKAASRGS